LVNEQDLSILLKESNSDIIIDVRSPSEFFQGHICNAVNMPLLNDEERAVVGTLYKQTSPEFAMIKGLEIIGPKMKDFASVFFKLKGKRLIVYCWRGGQRSNSIAWLMRTCGLNPIVIPGGYKHYRNHVLDWVNNKYLKLYVLGGKTGTGKTELLEGLDQRSQQILDLEGLANHKGSAFGHLGQNAQPTDEQFQNNLFHEMIKLNLSRPIWIENESRMVGRLCVPAGIWASLRNGNLINVEISEEERLDHVLSTYGQYDIEDLIESFKKIEKKLGNLAFNNTLIALQLGDLRTAAKLAFFYYDKNYGKKLDENKSQNITYLNLAGFTFEQKINKLLEYASTSGKDKID